MLLYRHRKGKRETDEQVESPLRLGGSNLNKRKLKVQTDEIINFISPI